MGINKHMATSSTTTKYNDLLQYIREVVELRNKLVNNPTEKDLNTYKLLTKTFGAYYRIKNNPALIIDSIADVDIPQNQVQNQVQTQIQSHVQTLHAPITRPYISVADSSSSDDNEHSSYADYLFGDSNDADNKQLVLFPQKSEINDEDEDEDDSKDVEELFDELEFCSETPQPDKDSEVTNMYKKANISLNRAISQKSYIVIADLENTDEDNDAEHDEDNDAKHDKDKDKDNDAEDIDDQNVSSDSDNNDDMYLDLDIPPPPYNWEDRNDLYDEKISKFEDFKAQYVDY